MANLSGAMTLTAYQADAVIGFDSSFPGGFTIVLLILVPLLMVLVWALLGGNRANGAIADKTERIPLQYGYTVCLITLIWAFVSFMRVVENVLVLPSPEMRRTMEYGFEPSITSFEAFRISYDRSRAMAMPGPPLQQLDSVPEAELRKRYEVFRADRITRAKFQATQEIVTQSVSFLIALALFAFHWRWVRRRGGSVTPGAVGV